MSGHSCDFTVTERDPNGIATLWLGECQCGENFTGSDYPDVEAAWDAHRKPKHQWEEHGIGDDRLLCCSCCPEMWWPSREDPPTTVCTPVEVAA